MGKVKEQLIEQENICSPVIVSDQVRLRNAQNEMLRMEENIKYLERIISCLKTQVDILGGNPAICDIITPIDKMKW